MEQMFTSRSIADEQKIFASEAIARIVADALVDANGCDEKALEALAVGAAKAMRAGFAEINRVD